MELGLGTGFTDRFRLVLGMGFTDRFRLVLDLDRPLNRIGLPNPNPKTYLIARYNDINGVFFSHTNR